MYDFMDIRVLIPAMYRHGLATGQLELNGSVLRYAGNKKVISWLEVVNPGKATEEVRVKNPTGELNAQNLANLNIAQMGVQVVSNAMIMRKLGQIQRVVESIDIKMNEALKKLDTIERNQVLNFTKYFMRGFTALEEEQYEEAAKCFRTFRSDVRHYFLSQDPVHLLAHYDDFVAPIGKAVAMTAVLESRAYAEMGSSKYHDAAKKSYELLVEMTGHLSIRDQLMSMIHNKESMQAIDGYKDNMPELRNALPELEASYAVQSLYLDIYCEKRAEIKDRLTR